jgi:hypothetical protein
MMTQMMMTNNDELDDEDDYDDANDGYKQWIRW